MSDTEALIREVQGELIASLKAYKQFHRTAAQDIFPDGPTGAYGVLMVLQLKPRSNGQAIADHLGLDKGAVSRYLQTLEEAGLAIRSPAPEDGRASIWTTSALADEKLDAIRAKHQDSWASKLSSWEPGRLNELLHLLRDLNLTLS